MNHRVTSEQIASYRENGFLIIEDFLNESELETWRSAVDEAVSLRDRNRLPQGSYHLARKVTADDEAVFRQRINLWMDHEGVRALMLDGRLGKMAADLEGVDGIRIWHDQVLTKLPWANPTTWHQDNTKWSFESVHAITIWVALDEVTVQNGCMFFMPGSHRKRRDDFPAAGKQVGAMFDAYPDLGRMDPVPVVMPAGGCSFHNGLIVHAANANMTPHPRRAFTCAYMPDHSTFNGIPNVLPNRILDTIEIGDPLDDDTQNPLIYSNEVS
ncbi:MAG: phytanoyl-CoA dioxygenase family protein [Gemmatimonadetes bacterium]|nr:phytanoyl-CoA dioxygenase family protein [Gemmatimonadota bacterium]MYK97452.1 phytanoyl-CoA dioxygenase family protein [Gemmatimonadota bacterium]